MRGAPIDPLLHLIFDTLGPFTGKDGKMESHRRDVRPRRQRTGVTFVRRAAMDCRSGLLSPPRCRSFQGHRRITSSRRSPSGATRHRRNAARRLGSPSVHRRREPRYPGHRVHGEPHGAKLDSSASIGADRGQAGSVRHPPRAPKTTLGRLSSATSSSRDPAEWTLRRWRERRIVDEPSVRAAMVGRGATDGNCVSSRRRLQHIDGAAPRTAVNLVLVCEGEEEIGSPNFTAKPEVAATLANPSA